MARNKASKRSSNPSNSELKVDSRVQKVHRDRRICRQMLDQVLKATTSLGLPPFANLTRERVAELRKIFSKGPVEEDIRKRAADSRRRKAATADLRDALDYINKHGIKRKQNDDGSYEPGEEEDGKEAIDEEETKGKENEEEEGDEEEEEERQTDGDKTEKCREWQTDSDIDMGDDADEDEQVQGISRGVRRLKLVVHKKE